MEIDHDATCQRCGVEDDIRTLDMSCGYDMKEMPIPWKDRKTNWFSIDVCKKCRASWMEAIDLWFVEAPAESPGTGIFIRRYGASIEISEEEWDHLSGGKVEPVRLLNGE